MTRNRADVLTPQFARNRDVVHAASGVRRFVEDDIEQVADLHRRVFGTAEVLSADLMASYRRFFSEVFFAPAPHADGVHSLVYEDGQGSIIGFQGVQPRRMLFEGRPIVMAVLSHFAVDAARRGVTGVRLLKQCLDGPQDLTFIDESNDNSRKIWEWSGGRTALLYSMHWLRPLRPSQALLTLLMQHRSPGLARASAPFARIVDALFATLGPVRIPQPSGSRHELDESVLAGSLSEFAGGRALRPDYSDGSLSWILQRASTRIAGGPLRKILVEDEKGEVAGWYIYYANSGGIAQVLQIAARNETISQVLDHLIEDASQSGAIALAGRLDPPFAQALSEKYCLLYRRGHWTLIHSRRPELLHAIERGDAFLSRLEGEWCLHFK
jgi:hypothetical protein